MFFNTIVETKTNRINIQETVYETVKEWHKFYNKPIQFAFTVEDVLEWVNQQLDEEQLTKKQIQGAMNNLSSDSGALPFVKIDSENYQWNK